MVMFGVFGMFCCWSGGNCWTDVLQSVDGMLVRIR